MIYCFDQSEISTYYSDSAWQIHALMDTAAITQLIQLLEHSFGWMAIYCHYLFVCHIKCIYFSESMSCALWVYETQVIFPQFIPIHCLHCIPHCKLQNAVSPCFPNKIKSLIALAVWILLAKDKETPCKETRCATADFPG